MTSSRSRGTKARPLAIFDFDHTISWADSLFPFLLLVARGRLIKHLPELFSVFFLLLVGRIDRDKRKQRLLTRIFRGMDGRIFAERSAWYGTTILPKIIRKQALRRIAWHKRQGHELVLISASLSHYLEHWAKPFGFRVIATEMKIVKGKVDGAFVSGNIRGQAKVRELKRRFSGIKKRETYVYGDSKDDMPMLRLATHAYFRSFSHPQG